MSIRNLDRIFKPKRIAVIGASHRPNTVGYTVLRNLIGAGYEGVVYPVNPNREAIQGIPAYPDVSRLPRTPDLAIIALPAALVPRIVGECGEAGIEGIIILSGGFREAGQAGLELEHEIAAIAAQYPNMRILGPNCLGVIVPSIGMNATFASGMPKSGDIAFISQSGALCTSVLDWAIQEGIGFSYFISVGNSLDVCLGDLVDYTGEETGTNAIILFAETITDARRFMSASRSFARSKPIVAYKAGRFDESARAAASHTGAMVTEDAVYEAAFERAGIVRVYDVNDMFECAELLAHHRATMGPRLAIVTNAGGPGVMATDALMARKGVLAELANETMEKLDTRLPPFWSHGNPIDVLCDASPNRYANATEVVLNDPGVDAVLVILTPQGMTNPTSTAISLSTVLKKTNKPVLAAWMGGQAVTEGIRILNNAGVPTYSSPEHAVNAFMHLVSYARHIEILYETPQEIPLSFLVDRDNLRQAFDSIKPTEPGFIPYTASQKLLETAGIPVIQSIPVDSPEKAVETANRIGYPVVLKVISPDIIHKTEVDGIVLNVQDADDVRSSYRRLLDTVRRKAPDAHIEGVFVQPFENADHHGVEVILGATRDPVFGMVVMVGAGGVTTELYRDRVLGFPPLNERLARRMLERMTCWPMLTGYRGQPALNTNGLLESLIRLSYLVTELPDIEQLDINPLLVTHSKVLALDIRIRVDTAGPFAVPGDTRRKGFTHLAIPPCPQHYTLHTEMRNGQSVTFRPITPEDEPHWTELLAGCSPESVHGRFHHVIGKMTHDIASRACFIDYDRELAIVAIIQNENGHKEMIGVARMVADPDRNAADFGILIADKHQGKGLGRQLTKYCLDLAEDWQLTQVSAITNATNPKMVRIFENLGFKVTRDAEDDIVCVEKTIQQ